MIEESIEKWKPYGYPPVANSIGGNISPTGQGGGGGGGGGGEVGKEGEKLGKAYIGDVVGDIMKRIGRHGVVMKSEIAAALMTIR